MLASLKLHLVNPFKSMVTGPTLPSAEFRSTITEFQNGVILIGGSSQVETLYQLTSPFGTWTEMKQTLKQEREWNLSFLVPDELVN